MLPDKIHAMLTGVLLGDLLGSTVEGLTRQQVKERHGKITSLLPGSTITDDWRLTAVVAEALIASGLNMDAQAAAHVAAFEQDHSRWGGNTKRAVIKLAHGYDWSQTGELLGIGNGVVMKLSPVAAVLAAGAERERVEQFAIDLTRMTHATRLAVAASLAHLNALGWCLRIRPGNFSPTAFINLVVAHAKSAQFLTPTDPMMFDDLVRRLADLPLYARCGPARIAKELLGNGYVWNSLPFSYAHFLRHPFSVKSMFEAVSAGQDADTNGSMVGSLLGALHGTVVFPASLIEQVDAGLRAEVVDLARRLAGRFNP